MRNALDKIDQQRSASAEAESLPSPSTATSVSPAVPQEFAEFARQLTSSDSEYELEIPPSDASQADPPAPPKPLFPFRPAQSEVDTPDSMLNFFSAPPAPVEPAVVAEPESASVPEPPLDLAARGLMGPLDKRRSRQVAEAVDALRAAIARQRAQVLLMAGCGPTSVLGDLALRLAAGLAQGAQGATLLIDADAHDRWLTMRLGMFKSPGWTDAVLQWLSWGGILRPTTIPGLVICPIGTQLQGGPEIAAISQGKTLPWRELAAGENTILVFVGNAPKDHLECIGLACDAVCLMVDIGHASKTAIDTARKALVQTRLPNLGCLVVG